MFCTRCYTLVVAVVIHCGTARSMTFTCLHPQSKLCYSEQGMLSFEGGTMRDYCVAITWMLLSKRLWACQIDFVSIYVQQRRQRQLETWDSDTLWSFLLVRGRYHLLGLFDPAWLQLLAVIGRWDPIYLSLLACDCCPNVCYAISDNATFDKTFNLYQILCLLSDPSHWSWVRVSLRSAM